MSDAAALNGLHVIVTRPTEQAGDLLGALRDAGAGATLFPALNIEALAPSLASEDMRGATVGIAVSANAARLFGLD